MKRKHLFMVIVLLMLVPLFTMNCSRDDTALVRIQLVNVPEGAAQSSNSVFEKVFRWFVPRAWAGATWTYSFDRLIVKVSAPDLETLEYDIPISERELTFELPAGSQRRITVYGMNNDEFLFYYDKNWGGHIEVNLNPGDDVSLQINMLPMVKLTSVYYLEPTVELYWTGVSPNYGSITGYNIYRSTNPTGPFTKVAYALYGQAFVNYESNHEPGVQYYYTIGVVTPTTEGELSTNFLYQYNP